MIDLVPYLAEQRGMEVDRGSPLPPLHLDLGVAIRAANHPACDIDHETLANRRRCQANQAHAPRSQFGNRPFSGVFAGPRRDEVIWLALQPEKTEHGGERRQPDAPFTQPPRVQPGLVELETRGQEVRDTLMKAGDEQPTDRGIAHTIRCGKALRSRTLTA